MKDVAFHGGESPVHPIRDVDCLVNGDIVPRFLALVWCTDEHGHWLAFKLVLHLWNVLGGESSQGGSSSVHGGADSGTGEVEVTNDKVWDLRWQRWADIELWLISAQTEEPEWNDLVGTAVARQERESWVLATIGDDVVVVLLGELEPWCTEVWKDTVQRISICGASGWGDGVGSNGIYEACQQSDYGDKE